MLQLECGACISCRIRRKRDWALRCMHEAQMWPANSFLTLTYNDENLPEDHSLNVKHWQDFAKRLRKARGAFRFLHCGEYGEGLRPHYHACIFGQDFTDDRELWKVEDGNKLFTSKSLEKIWGKGFCTIGDLNYATASYVAGYVVKKQTGAEATAAEYERVDAGTGLVTQVKPDYATMSRGNKKTGGLGKKWFDKYWTDVYPDDFVVADGGKYRPPKYYDKLLERMNPEMFEQMRRRRIRHASEKPWEHTPERLWVKDEVCLMRLQKRDAF